MDKTVEYREIIKTIMREYERIYNSPPDPDIPTHFVCDDAGGNYMLITVGWKGKTRHHHITSYVRLEDGKFWIEEEWTEEGIATDLLAAGVPNTDIVLGFQPPEMRPYTEFAAA